MNKIFGVDPDYMGVELKPFIRDKRYVKTKGGKGRRLAVHQKNRQWFEVGYPRLKLQRIGGELKPIFEIWSGNGGETFEEATDYLNFHLTIFKAEVEFYNKHGYLPKRF